MSYQETVSDSGKAAASVKRASSPKKKLSRKEQQRIDELILTHRENGRKLARSFLRRWRVRMSAEEVDSIVDLTLCEAAKRFDENRGASFMTFLYYHLRGQLVRAVESATNNSTHFLSFSQASGVDISEWAVTGSGSDPYIFSQYYTFQKNDAETPEGLVLKKESFNICEKACGELDELEQEIINRSFTGDEPLVDIARSLGYSRCHISRVKKRALERLRSIIENRHIANKQFEAQVTIANANSLIQDDQSLTERTSVLERCANSRGRARRRSRRSRVEVKSEAKAA